MLGCQVLASAGHPGVDHVPLLVPTCGKHGEATCTCCSMFTGGVAAINADVGLLGLRGKRARLVFARLTSTWPGGFGTHLVCRDSKTTV